MINFARTISIMLCLLIPPAVFGQSVQTTAPAPNILLSVGGEVEHPLKLTAADLAKLPRRTVRAKDHGGKESAFEGVELAEVLKLANVNSARGCAAKVWRCSLS